MAITPRMPKTTMPTTIQTHGLTLPAMCLTGRPQGLRYGVLRLPNPFGLLDANRIVAPLASRDGLQRGRFCRGAIAVRQCQPRHLEVRASLHPAGRPRHLREPQVGERLV